MLDSELISSIENILSDITLNTDDNKNIDNTVQLVSETLLQIYPDIDIGDIYCTILTVIESQGRFAPEDSDQDSDQDYDSDSDDNFVNNHGALLELEKELQGALNDVQKYKGTILKDQVKYLQTVFQPEQRSPEWYTMRKDMCTASDIGSILELSKYGNRKQIILKKCGKGPPFTGNKFTRHGQCYEDIACSIYMSRRKDCKVLEFGLIQHPKISFLGASPDGITTDGIMIEIKCPYTRKINGDIYSASTFGYWVQIQIQLEVCNLNKCDFFECGIVEYKNEEEYMEDVYNSDEVTSLNIIHEKAHKTAKPMASPWAPAGDSNLSYIKIPDNRRSSNGLEKGIIGRLYNKDTRENEYIYPPFNVSTRKQLKAIKKKTKKLDNHLTFVSNIYWKLNKSSNVIVLRDKNWFLHYLPELSSFWDEVLFRRQSSDGCDDLITKKKKAVDIPKFFLEDIPSCLLDVSDDDDDVVII